MLATTTFNTRKIKQAAKFLAAGELVVFPTETVYGLGGNALSDDAVAAIYEAKGRPSFNPLIVHLVSKSEAKKYVEWPDTAVKLAAAFWPGSLTLVLPRSKDCKLSLLVSAGMDTVAVRVPAHPMAQALLQAVKLPIAAPSANISGRTSPTQASHTEELKDKVAMILDGGACTVGIESTVIDLSEKTPVILRPGAITLEQINTVLCHSRESRSLVSLSKSPAFAGMTNKIKSPGMMERHYAPNKPVRLNATEIKPGEALLAFGAPLAGATIIENLSAEKDLKEAAANLFRMLRALDATAAKSIAVMPIPEEGLGAAINDRLTRAAAR
jgi:L-threonylcarbamoyladenylate synthase